MQQAVKNDSENAVAHYQLGVAFINSKMKAGRNRSGAKRCAFVEPLRRAALAGGPWNCDAAISVAWPDRAQIIAAEPNSPDGFLVERHRGYVAQAIQRCAAGRREGHADFPAELCNLRPVRHHPTGAKNTSPMQKNFTSARSTRISSFQRSLKRPDDTYFAEKQPDKAIAAAQPLNREVPQQQQLL